MAETLASYPNISYEHLPNSSRFKMTSEMGVKWSDKSTELGNIHYKKNYLYLALDYSIGEFSESDILKKSNVPLKQSGSAETGFYIKQAGDAVQFDTVRISLYLDELLQMNFKNNELIDFILEVFNASI